MEMFKKFNAPPPFGKDFILTSYVDANYVMILPLDICHRNIALDQSDCDGLLLKETNLQPDCNLWFRVYGS